MPRSPFAWHSVAATPHRRCGPAIFRTSTSVSTPTIAADVSTSRELAPLITRLEGILERVEGILPPAPPPPDWRATAFRWRKRGGRGYLQAILHPHSILVDDLVAVDEQKRAIDANTRQ